MNVFWILELHIVLNVSFQVKPYSEVTGNVIIQPRHERRDCPVSQSHLSLSSFGRLKASIHIAVSNHSLKLTLRIKKFLIKSILINVFFSKFHSVILLVSRSKLDYNFKTSVIIVCPALFNIERVLHFFPPQCVRGLEL